MGAYYAARWVTQLVLFTLDEGTETLETEISYAKTYLRKLNIDFEYVIKRDRTYHRGSSASGSCGQ